MPLLKGYPEGSDITILNTSYHYPRKGVDGKYGKDYMTVVFKNNITGKKHHQIVYNPTYRFYMANDDVTINHNMFYISKDKVHEVECEFGQLEKTIAEKLDALDFFYENIRMGNRRNNRALHRHPRVFSSDTNIEDHWRARFAQDYQNDIKSITKGYFDIEVDTKRMAGDFPQMGECPVNAVSYIDDTTNTINIFLLRDINGDNPLINEFEENFANQNKAKILFKELQEFIIENVSGIENAKKFKVDNFNFQFMFFDTEIELITSLFRVINANSPDFLLAWNMAFDIPYLIERVAALGYDPALILSDSNYEEKYATYYIDERHKNEYELRGDSYDIASNIVYIDQLVQFASRRKGQAAFPNFKLDTAADIITKGAVRKLDYSHITTNLTNLPYLDYKTFVFYNIMDTIAQRCIEETVQDVNYIYSVCTLNDTRYSKGHRQTVYLTNKTRKYFYENGLILGNNCNTGESVPFPGAMVGDPTHNSDYGKLRDRDQIYNIYDNCDDFDFKALYPNITSEHNTAPDTIVGKILIDHKVHSRENPYHNEQYDRGGQFVEDLCTDNILEFCKRWMHLAGFRELLDDMDEYFTTHIPMNPVNIYTENGLIKPFTVYPNAMNVKIKPFRYLEEGEMIKPFYIDTSNKEDILMQLHKVNDGYS